MKNKIKTLSYVDEAAYVKTLGEEFVCFFDKNNPLVFFAY